MVADKDKEDISYVAVNLFIHHTKYNAFFRAADIETGFGEDARFLLDNPVLGLYVDKLVVFAVWHIVWRRFCIMDVYS